MTLFPALSRNRLWAFDRMTVDVEDADEEDIWNQIVDDLDLDNHMRSIWREVVHCFTVLRWYVVGSQELQGSW